MSAGSCVRQTTTRLKFKYPPDNMCIVVTLINNFRY